MLNFARVYRATNNKQATTKKEAFDIAGVNSLLHVHNGFNCITASLYIEDLATLHGKAPASLGRTRMLTVRQGRRLRSRSLARDTGAFIEALRHDVASVTSKAERKGIDNVILRLPVVLGVDWGTFEGVTVESFLMA